MFTGAFGVVDGLGRRERVKMEGVIIGALFVFAGLFCIWGAFMNFDWFMNSSRAWLVVKILGRGGARIFYMVLGAVIVVAGILAMLGILKNAS